MFKLNVKLNENYIVVGNLSKTKKRIVFSYRLLYKVKSSRHKLYIYIYIYIRVIFITTYLQIQYIL